jgi:hypothetical protein
MSKTEIKKEDFYKTLVDLMSHANKSVHFYSISCCYGFYSSGLKTFESVYLAIRERLSKRVSGRYLDVRILVKIDKDNPMDTYAMERLAFLENQFSHTSNDEHKRTVFKQLILDGRPNENVQFIIIDDEKILLSKVQDESFNLDLDLVLNKSEAGSLFSKEDHHEDFQVQKQLFEDKWKSSSPLDIEIKQVSKRRLKYALEKFTISGYEKGEREVQLVLSGYLRGRIGLPVNLETPVGKNRIDLTVGLGPMINRHAIEVKFKPDNNAIKEIIGQMENYRKEFENLFLVICKPQYNQEARSDLNVAIAKNDVILFEVKE